ncbi:ComEC/Rec2 family competence protein [bacterium]|nr:ComEC/Rec2 family competence protein [candidate division CSSED10-310 bacterium]
MQRNIQLLTLGFILGIVLARSYPLALPPIVYLLGAAGLMVLVGIIFYLKGQPINWLMVFAAVLLGAANFSYRSEPGGEDHIIHFANDTPFQGRSTVYGRIVKEPEVRERYTLVEVEPRAVQKSGSTLRHGIRDGIVQVRVYPSIGDYYERLAYGDEVIVKGTLARPPLPSNPYVLDMRRSLQNRGVHAVMRARLPYEIEIDESGGGNVIVKAALVIKRHMLQTIKKTIPAPESAFLGGVMLGLRGGLSRDVQDQFRAAGVSHVLAVSGLHVTIITALFVAIFTILKVPGRITGPSIIVALILFTLITGARPSTVRAAIMNSVGLISFYIMGLGVRASLLFSISVAALAILIPNPLIIGEASFLFSFSAVLSLGILTTPINTFLNRRARSFLSLAFILVAFFLLGCFINDISFIHQPPLALFIMLGLLPVGFILDRLMPHRRAYRDLPFWFRSFFAAQMAIQLGMGPLTVFYFNRLSLAAPLANFLAIPLIGVIVQLGILAGLLDFIPVIGAYPALLLNASNWIFIKLFLGSAAFFARHIPYPFVQQPTSLFFIIYYGFLGLFAWRVSIAAVLQDFHARFKRVFKRFKAIRLRVLLAGTAGITALALIGVTTFNSSVHTGRLSMIVLDPTIFNLGGGSAILVNTPGGGSLLFNGCPREMTIGNNLVMFDLGEMLILPVLLRSNIARLDRMVLTSPDPTHAGGLISVLKHIKTDQLWDTVPYDDADFDCDAFVDAVADTTLQLPKNDELKLSYCTTYKELREEAGRGGVEHHAIQAGGIIYQESAGLTGSAELVIRALGPPADRTPSPYAWQTYAAVIVIEYGDVRLLLCPSLNTDGERLLVTGTAQDLACDVMVASPFLMGPVNGPDQFLAASAPRLVIFPYRSQRETNRLMKKTLSRFESAGITAIRTDRCGAVTLETDGKTITIDSKLHCVEAKGTISL